MNSKTTADSTAGEDASLPSRETLAAIAAASRKKPGEAVSYALAVWQEAGKALAAVAQARERRGYEHIPPPRKHKDRATLNEFFRRIVKGKTREHSRQRLFDYYRHEYTRTFCGNRADLLTDEDKGEIEARANSEINSWGKAGFRKEQWFRLAQRYLDWWEQHQSA